MSESKDSSMADSGNSPETHPDDAVQHSLPDYVLQLLVKLAQENELEVAITLSVSSGLVTGVLVGRDRWFRELGDYLERKANRPDARALADAFREALAGDEEDVPLSNWSYIHLINARYVSGSQLIPSSEPMLWRGRLAEVAGFSFGALGEGK